MLEILSELHIQGMRFFLSQGSAFLDSTTVLSQSLWLK
jgi:hypothetical protein